MKGTYVQLGQAVTFERAIKGISRLISKQQSAGSALRVQVMHTFNPEGAQMLHDLIDKLYECTWLPIGSISIALGAHPGPSMVGVVYAPVGIFNELYI